MANTYNWTIHNLDVYPNQDTLSDVVYNIHWRLTAVSDQEEHEGTYYTSSSIGTQIVANPDSENFTAFEDLTKKQVVGWLENSELDIDAIKKSLDAQIVEKITPTSVSKTPQWQNN